MKVYPVNVKLLSGAISPLSYSALIVAGAVHVASAAFQLNEIVYVIGVHFAMKYMLPLASALADVIDIPVKLNSVVASAPDKYRYSSTYPVFVAFADTCAATVAHVVFSATTPLHISSPIESPVFVMK